MTSGEDGQARWIDICGKIDTRYSVHPISQAVIALCVFRGEKQPHYSCIPMAILSV